MSRANPRPMTAADEPHGGGGGGLVDRYQNLPRSMKWLIWLGVVVVVFLLVVEPMLASMSNLNAETEDTLAAVDEIENRDRTLETRQRIEEHFGQPRLVSADDLRSLGPRVRGVLNDNGITAPRISAPDAESFDIPDLGDTGSSIRLQRATVTAQFVAAPEVLTSILEELEADPRVARIPELTARKLARDRALDVSLVVESWSTAGG